MRPSVPEQLAGLERILAAVIVPEIGHPYPLDIAGGVGAALGALSAAWYEIPAFHQWDLQVTAALLADATPYLDAALADEVASLRAALAEGPLALDALETRHADARALLARAVPTLVASPPAAELCHRLAEHFRARADRFPLALARPAGAPNPTVPKEGS
jgi:hypothetical protein